MELSSPKKFSYISSGNFKVPSLNKFFMLFSYFEKKINSSYVSKNKSYIFHHNILHPNLHCRKY